MGSQLKRRAIWPRFAATLLWAVGLSLAVARGASAQFAPTVHYPTGVIAWEVKVGDLDGDGAPDLVTANYIALSYSVLMGNGDGTFAAPVTQSLDFLAPSALEILDVNEDGDLDLVMASENPSRVFWLPGLGDGTFGPAADLGDQDYAEAAYPFALAFDPSARLLAVSGRSTNLHYFLQQTPGGFLSMLAFPTGGDDELPVSVALWTEGFVPGTPAINYATLVQANSGTHTIRVMSPPDNSELHATGLSPRGIAAADLNRDGRTDVVVANSGSGTLSVLLNTGGSSFAPATHFAVGGTPAKVAIGDVNADDKPDVVVTNSELGGGVSVLLGAGDGSFGAPLAYATAAYPQGVAMADLNGDGMLDVVVACEASGVSVLLNALTPNCRFATSVTAFSSEQSATAGSAQQVLGPPDVYPGYGPAASAWSGATPDGQPEYLELGFPAPAPINFVNVLETHAPGAITSIRVRNPASGLFEQVWSRAAAPAPPVARLFTATFPATMFAVSEIRIEFDSPSVPGSNEVDAVSIGYQDRRSTSQWATGIVAFSSEYGAQYSATSALGAPNVYPAYGDLGESWASLTPDGQFEFLELSYATPQPINYVSVYETYAPGALERVWVMNPNTGLYETVWSAFAAPAPALARIHTVSFPETRFPVSQVRLDFNSPAVPDWNEVDAVGIGRCACEASIVDAPPPVRPREVSTIRGVHPSPFREVTDIEFTLARAGRTRVEVFDIRGQHVAEVLDRELPAGAHRARWNGRSAGGQDARAGIYFVRVESGGAVSTRRVVRIR